MIYAGTAVNRAFVSRLDAQSGWPWSLCSAWIASIVSLESRAHREQSSLHD